MDYEPRDHQSRDHQSRPHPLSRNRLRKVSPSIPQPLEFADPPAPQPLSPQLSLQRLNLKPLNLKPLDAKPLELLYNTERSLRVKTVDTIEPLLSEELAVTIVESSQQAEVVLSALADIDLQTITDAELRPARILVGLTLTGFGSLMMLFLLLCWSTWEPELSPVTQLQHHWHQYVWFVSMGVTGLAMLAREAMRSSAFVGDAR